MRIMMNGIIIVNKEAGFTSHDVVAKLRGICGQKKIGHTGTLDPDAVGVLPVCLGNATKLCDMLTDRSKEYEAVLLLGKETDTQDLSGRVLKECAVDVAAEKVQEAILSFVGGYDQIPPMYSALKVNGKKLYELARAGKEVERAGRRVDISSIEILETALPRVRFRVCCSKGTYIRTLCHDIGRKLGCGGAMQSLKRTRVGEFCLQDALSLEEIEALKRAGCLEGKLIPVEEMFREYPRLVLMPDACRMAENGNALYPSQFTARTGSRKDGERIRVCSAQDRFYGVYAWNAGQGRYLPVKMFL